MDFTKKRWISLIAAMLSALFAAVIYSWSVYVRPLADVYGWSTSSISLAYSINTIMCGVVALLCSGLRARMTISGYTLLGTLFYGSGIVLCSFIQGSIYELYLYFGVLTGTGIGFIYVSLASYVVQLFPDKKGLAAGLYTACYGCGALFWAPAASYIIENMGGIDNAFLYLGLFFSAGLVVTTRFLAEVPDGFAKTLHRGEASRAAVPPLAGERTPGEVLSSPLFYLLLLIYTCGLTSGMMMLSLGSPIVQATLGYAPEQAAVIVGMFAVASTLGRLVWGWLSDLMGRINVLLTLGLISCAAMLVLANVAEEYLFLAALLTIPLCYGAYAATLSPMVHETFGSTHFTMNYNLLFCSFSLAAIIGPQISSYADATGGYSAAFACAAVFGALVLVLSLVFKWYSRRLRQNRKTTSTPAL